MSHVSSRGLLLAAVMGALWCGAAAAPAAERPPNVVLIVADDQGWTDFGFMGHKVLQTPRLDRLAAESALFPNGYVPTSLCRASLATLLTGRRLTDTSFGLRAMRVEVTGSVTLNQPQYQSSELLLGVLSHGYRVQEVAGRMHVRSSGSTKKGTNLVYGRRYAAAMTGTWWREGCPRPVDEIAPALRQTR